jgi:hypothetical protein
MRPLCSIWLLVAASAWGAPPAAPKVVAAFVDHNNRNQILIYFDNPVPLPPVVAQWQAVVFEKTGSGQSTSVKRIENTLDPGNLSADHTERFLLVSLNAAVDSNNIKEIDILLITPQGLISVPALTKPSQLATGTRDTPGEFVAAKGKADADIYFNGSYSRVQNGDPVWDIDAFAGYMHPLSGNPNAGRIGLYGQVRTKQSPVADPNSFLTYLVYQNVIGSGGWWGPFQAPIFDYRFFGSEFDRTAKELTLITSPELTIPFRPIPPPQNESSKVLNWPAFNLIVGEEFVDVRKSVLAPVNKWHRRDLFGASFSAGFGAKRDLFDSIQVTSSWQVRLPSAPEIFYDDKFAPIDPTTGKKNTKKTPPMLGTQPRHWFDTKVTYNFVPWAGVTFEHSYGSLPPAFNKTDQTFAFGLSFNLQEGRFGRTAILRP